MDPDLNKAVLDHLCATNPVWSGARQVVQLAKAQTNDDLVNAAAQLVCAIVLLASETPNPQAFLDHCASSLRDV